MFFRLQPYKSPGVLNSFQNWTDSADPDGMAVVIRLKNQLDRILDRATDEKGMVDYLSVAEDPTYWNFEEAASELQAIDSVAGMDNRTKIAFGINLYNMMIKHAHIKFGIPSKFFQRSIFFSGVSYNIGGDVLSANELHHGVLRANSLNPRNFSDKKPFPKSDRRRDLVVSKVDPRIHFAFELNWGMKSPPVRTFTVKSIEEELRAMAVAFCDDDENITVDEKRSHISLPAVMELYWSDFQRAPEHKFGNYLRGEKRKKVQRMIQGKDVNIQFSYKSYEWKNNASNCKKFQGSALSDNRASLRGALIF